MPEKESKSRKRKLEKVEEYLKSLPPPPPEHIAELKMEKELQRIIRKEEKRKKAS